MSVCHLARSALVYAGVGFGWSVFFIVFSILRNGKAVFVHQIAAQTPTEDAA